VGAAAAEEVATQKKRNLFRQEEAGPLLQAVSAATPGEGAATYLGGQPTVGAEQDVGIPVEQAAQKVPPRVNVADRIQPIQLLDAGAGGADEPAAHVVRGVLQLACTSTRIQQGQREGGHAHSGSCHPERPHSRAGCQHPRQPTQRQSAAPAPVSGNVSDTLGTANITCTSSSVPGNGTCVKTQCASIFRARMRTAASSGSLPTHTLRLPPITAAYQDGWDVLDERGIPTEPRLARWRVLLKKWRNKKRGISSARKKLARCCRRCQ
jgi:hypothetical protein